MKLCELHPIMKRVERMISRRKYMNKRRLWNKNRRKDKRKPANG